MTSTEPLRFTDIDALVAHIRDVSVAPRVWAYCRVSGSKQDDSGFSLEGQRDAILTYCASKNLGVPTLIEEVASAGKPLLAVSLPGRQNAQDGNDARPLFATLLAHLLTSPKSVLVFWKMDRFARLADEQEMMLRMLWNADVAVHSTAPGEANLLDPNGVVDPSRALMRQVLGAIAQYERATIAIRMQLGARAKASRGGWVWGGAPPYGYVMTDQDLVIQPDDAHFVRVVFWLRRCLGLSLRDIGESVTRYGAPQPFDKGRVARILRTEPLYRGVYIDPFNNQHDRSDLVILPNDLESWALSEPRVNAQETPTYVRH